MHEVSNLRWIGKIAIALVVSLAFACSTETKETAETAETAAASQESEPSEEIQADPASFPEVVATVNGTDIRKSELMERVAGIEREMRSPQETTSIAFYRRVLDEIVGTELLYQASKERNLAVDAAAVDEQLAMLRGRFPDPTMFEQALAQQGLTLDDLEEQIERDMSIQKLIETDITPKVTVSEEAKRGFYDDNPEQMRQPDRLRLSHILKRVAPDASAESKEATRVGLEDILDQAQGGADFAALAREHSEDPGSAPNGGELVVARGETVPPFEEAAFALEPGEVSPVVETQFGFHIIRLSERIDGQLVPYDQVETRIEEFLRQRELRDEVERTVQALKADASIDVFI